MSKVSLTALAAGMMWVGMANAGDAPKWGGHIEVEGKAGTKRNLGEADLFLPVAQDSRTLLFADIRTRMDDNDSREGNFGLGLRRLLDSGWNLGGYGFFDRRRSPYHNYFNQITVGAEALSLDWDFRANGYVPVGRRSYDVESLNSAELSGASVIFKGGEEHSLAGFDAEIGWRLPVFADDASQQLRVYGGGYHFFEDGVDSVTGPRGRAELVFDEIPGLWDGSRLALGAEWQRDDARGSQGFLSARLRIPLQSEASPSRLTPMERRMTDPIVRDIDVVAQAGAFGAAETVTTTSSGNTLSVVTSAANAAALNTALTNAGANSTVILSGSFTTTDTITLQAGQTVMGSGSVTVRSASGRTATLTRSSGATISATLDNLESAFTMANNSTLKGMTINPVNNGNVGVFGVQATGVTGFTVSGNTITVTGDATVSSVIGIRLLTSASGTISGNTVRATNDNNGTAMGLQMITSSTAAVSGNSFYARSGGTEYGAYVDGATLSGSGNSLSVSGTGVAVTQACKTLNTTGTSFGYGTNSTCGNVNN